MYAYKLIIAYDGTCYSGWQIQPNASSIQQVLQNVLKILLRTSVPVIGSGRTDAGAHAYGQVAHFKHTQFLDLSRFLLSLNGILPRDIRIKKIEPVSLDFHAQYSAIGKEYHYYLHLDPVMDPFRRLYCWHIHQKIDLDTLVKGSTYFVGTHDFTSFANEAHTGSAAHDPIRTLYRLDIKNIEEGVRFEFEGDGFLYKMVRNIVGTLVEAASGKRPLEEIQTILEMKDRRRAGIAAPSRGLFLVRVDYP